MIMIMCVTITLVMSPTGDGPHVPRRPMSLCTFHDRAGLRWVRNRCRCLSNDDVNNIIYKYYNNIGRAGLRWVRNRCRCL